MSRNWDATCPSSEKRSRQQKPFFKAKPTLKILNNYQTITYQPLTQFGTASA